MSEDCHISGGAMYSTGCPICGATEQPHKEGCMHRTCYRPMEAKDPLQGNTITELEEMVERHAGIDMLGEGN